MNIHLPDTLTDFISEQVNKNHLPDPDQYIASLVLEEQKRLLRADIEEKIREGLNSPSLPMPSIEEFRAEARKRAGLTL